MMAYGETIEKGDHFLAFCSDFGSVYFAGESRKPDDPDSVYIRSSELVVHNTLQLFPSVGRDASITTIIGQPEGIVMRQNRLIILGNLDIHLYHFHTHVDAGIDRQQGVGIVISPVLHMGDVNELSTLPCLCQCHG